MGGALTGSAPIVVQQGGFLNFTNGAMVGSGVTGIVNDGTVTFAPGAGNALTIGVGIAPTVGGQGSLVAQSGTTTLTAPVNAGSIAVQGGTLVLGGDSFLSQGATVAAGARLRVGVGTVDTDAGTITGDAGTLFTGSAGVALAPGAVLELARPVHPGVVVPFTPNVTGSGDIERTSEGPVRTTGTVAARDVRITMGGLNFAGTTSIARDIEIGQGARISIETPNFAVGGEVRNAGSFIVSLPSDQTVTIPNTIRAVTPGAQPGGISVFSGEARFTGTTTVEDIFLYGGTTARVEAPMSIPFGGRSAMSVQVIARLVIGDGGTQGWITTPVQADPAAGVQQGQVNLRGVLEFNRSDNVLWQNSINSRVQVTRIQGTLRQAGSGTLTVEAVDRFDVSGGVETRGPSAVGLIEAQNGRMIIARDLLVAPDEFPSVAAVISPGATLQLGNGGAGDHLLGPWSVQNDGTMRLGFATANTWLADHTGIAGSTGGVTVAGPGVQSFSGTHAFTGPTAVEGGTLHLAGDISASSGLTVGPGGMLTGAGIAPGTALAGTIAPGNSLGTITIAGNFTNAPGSRTVMQVQGENSDRIEVSGGTTLGGTIAVTGIGGPYRFGTPYVLVNSAGPVSGSYAAQEVTGFGAGISPQIEITPNQVRLRLDPATLGGRAGLTVNGRSAAGALDTAAARGASLNPFFPVMAQQAGGTDAALRSIGGELPTAHAEMAFATGRLFTTTMVNPFTWGRETVMGTRLALGGNTASDADAALLRTDRLTSVWGQAFGAAGSQDGDTRIGSRDRNVTAGGLILGVDRRVGANAVLGVALQVGEARGSVSGHGSTRGNLFALGAYGFGFVPTPVGHVTLSGAASFGFMGIEQDRHIWVLGPERLRGETDARVFSYRLEARHEGLRREHVQFAPFAAVQGQVARVDGFREQGSGAAAAGALAVAGATSHQHRIELGIQAEGRGRIAGAPVRGFARVGWGHYLARDSESRAGFVALPAAGSFVTLGARPDEHVALLAAGVDGEIRSGLRLGARLDTELGATSRAVTGTLRLSWAF